MLNILVCVLGYVGLNFEKGVVCFFMFVWLCVSMIFMVKLLNCFYLCSASNHRCLIVSQLSHTSHCSSVDRFERKSNYSNMVATVECVHCTPC